MERQSHLVLAVATLCVCFCAVSHASPTLIPPDAIPPLPPKALELEDSQMGFLLTMPQVLQVGAEEQYCVTLHGYFQDRTFTMQLVKGEDEYDYTHTYINGRGQCNSFQVPDEPGKYEVYLQNETDTVATSEVQVMSNNLITFVQTDKPLYKPGQKVKFRILTMTRDLRSRIGEIESVFIKDPNDLKVKKYANVESKGMASLEFQLINEPKMGVWTIEVTVDGEVTRQTFKVEEYVLPRFEVTITPPSYFLVSSETFNLTVCADYTYGKPVSGFLNLKVCPKGYNTFDIPCATRRKEIEGCEAFSIESSDLLTGSSYGRSFTISASVTEMGTGVQVNGSATGPEVSYDYLQMSLEDDTNGYFKPGMPIHGRVKVTTPDGVPAAMETIQVTAQDYKELYLSKVFVTNDAGEVDYTICHGSFENISSISVTAEALNYSDDNDEKTFSYRMYRPRAHGEFRQFFSPSFSYIQIPAMKQSLQCGKELDLNVPFTHNGLKPFIKFYYQVMARGRILRSGTVDTPTLSDPLSHLEPGMDKCLDVKERPTLPPIRTPPTFDFVNITEPEEVIPEGGGEEGEDANEMLSPPPPPMGEIEEPISLEPVSEMFETLIVPGQAEPLRRKRSIMPPYQVGEAEKIVRPEDIADQVSNVHLTIPVTPEMSPSFSVLLFYVRDDGETIADSMAFKVEPCFENEVKMEFADKTVLPGAETTIHLEAAAGSVCSVGVVDKSINILGGDHQITPKQVFDKLAEYSLSKRGMYSYFRSNDEYCKDKMSDSEKEEEEEEGRFNWYQDRYTSNYVDAIEAFKQMGMLVLTDLRLETRPCVRNEIVYYDEISMPLMRQGVGFSVISGIPGPSGPAVAMLRGDSQDDNNVRSEFPETWLWDLHEVGDTGSMDLVHTVPDTITKWLGNSLCVNNVAGFGLSPVTSITTFQPFFLAMNLPYNAVRGERLPITITVYNYLDKCLHMLLMVDGEKGFKVHAGSITREPFCLCGGKSESKKVYITARDIGRLPLFARAEIVPGQCGNSVEMDTEYIGRKDAVRREVLVKAEGVTQRYSHNEYFCIKEGENYNSDFALPLPADMVPDSARAEITVIGDIMGPALSNLDHLVRMPTGCGEQNMVGFTPNIYVLKYLSATNQLTEVMQDKIKNFMEIGYQRELKYRHPDGSFSAFGPGNDKPGSTWLTAFVVKSFAQASPYIFVDEEDLEVSKNYLISVQNPEDGPLQGCFFERGEVFSSYMKGGLGKESNEAAMSAFVLIALLEAGLSPEDSVAMDGIGCINREVWMNPAIDAYSLALAAYANVLYDRSSNETIAIMNKLNQKATIDGSLKYWKREGEQPKPVESWYYYSAPSAEVEMTAYALMASLIFYAEDAVANSRATIMWLTKQRNAFGGFSSTQDTVLGLNSLAEFAEIAFSDELMDLTLSVRGRDIRTQFSVNSDNSLLLQRQEFNITRNSTMRTSATGSGCALIQANVYYNKLPNTLGIDNQKFRLRVDPRFYQHDRNKCGQRTIYITFGMRRTQQYSTGMTILTVRMVSGWSVIPESLKELRSKYPILGIQREEVKEDEGVINFYLDELDMRTRRMALDVEQNFQISGPKPAEVQIYQYYEKDVTVITSYSLKTTCGTKLSLPYDQPEPRDGEPIMQRRIESDRFRPAGLNRGASRATTASPEEKKPNCPVCNLVQIPDNYNEIICNSTAVYKAHAGRNKKYSLKIKSDLRPRRKLRMKKFAHVHMKDGCRCSLLDPPMKTVLIITQKENLVDDTLHVDSRTHIFNLRKNRALEKKARRARRKCQLP